MHIIWRFEQISNKLRQIIVKISVQHRLLYLKLHTRNKTEPASTWDDTCYRCFEKWTPCQAGPQKSGFQHANFKAAWVYCVFLPPFGRVFLFQLFGQPRSFPVEYFLWRSIKCCNSYSVWISVLNFSTASSFCKLSFLEMCPLRLVCDILLNGQCFPLSELGTTLFYIFQDLEFERAFTFAGHALYSKFKKMNNFWESAIWLIVNHLLPAPLSFTVDFCSWSRASLRGRIVWSCG